MSADTPKEIVAKVHEDADVDDDFGNVRFNDVKRMIEELETAGVSKLCIENALPDATFGKREPRLVSAQGKGGQDADGGCRAEEAPLAARTCAPTRTNLEDGIACMKAYHVRPHDETGAG